MHASMERQRPTWCSTSMAAGRWGLHSPTSTIGRNAHACRPCTDITESAMQKACLVQHIHGLQVGAGPAFSHFQNWESGSLSRSSMTWLREAASAMTSCSTCRHHATPLPRHRLGGVIRVELIVQQHVEAVGGEVAHLRQSQPDI